ncbi:MAG: UTP--glucose-1-phosphate uridylyltransferase [Verrucomicrobia bacterium]|nr:UTP--glucose-1-phosphate uridylyltransferase [Verrucomicrobiota bacterium]
MSRSDHFAEFASKMKGAGIKDAAIHAFRHSYNNLVAGQNGLIPEESIQPVSQLPSLEEVPARADESLLAQTVIVKLNGGLGTGMGLEGPKSLLPIKDNLTFLDFIARQVLHARRGHKQDLRFLLMNSFSTSRETLAYLKRYPELGRLEELELMQGQVPKVDANTLRPVERPAQPQLEWCPPGHGDLYPSLLGSGWLDRLLAEGVRYLFVSNADNLGASLDLGLLNYFAESNQSFLMEVAERTAADKKGGHLARGLDGGFLLRESAQCPEADLEKFQNIGRHRFFNTNNIWVRLDRLKETLAKNGGAVPLPLIKNSKTVDPRDKQSTPVFQLETAMGAAIECFDNAGAIKVPRRRFAPVKTTSDLLAIRSDAYQVTSDWRLVLAPEFDGQPPVIELDPDYYKLVEQLDSRLLSVPSLKHCQELRVRGPIAFPGGVTFKGKVELVNSTKGARPLTPGIYENTTITLGQSS